MKGPDLQAGRTFGLGEPNLCRAKGWVFPNLGKRMFSSEVHLAWVSVSVYHTGSWSLVGSWVPAAPGLPRLSWHLAATALKEYSCETDSTKYYALCSFGSILSYGLTDTTVVPLEFSKIPKCKQTLKHTRAYWMDSLLHRRKMVFVVWLKDRPQLWLALPHNGSACLVLLWSPQTIWNNMLREENTYLQCILLLSGARTVLQFCWHCPGSYGSSS